MVSRATRRQKKKKKSFTPSNVLLYQCRPPESDVQFPLPVSVPLATSLIRRATSWSSSSSFSSRLFTDVCSQSDSHRPHHEHCCSIREQNVSFYGKRLDTVASKIETRNT